MRRYQDHPEQEAIPSSGSSRGQDLGESGQMGELA
jgi:hypothetical protein